MSCPVSSLLSRSSLTPGAARRYPDVVVMVTRESVIKAAASMQNMGVARLSDSRDSNAQNGGRSGDNQLIWSACLGVT